MSMNNSYKDWNALITYLQSVDPPQCFTVNYKPHDGTYELWIGNQPYETYDRMIEDLEKQIINLDNNLQSIREVSMKEEIDTLKEALAKISTLPENNYSYYEALKISLGTLEKTKKPKGEISL